MRRARCPTLADWSKLDCYVPPNPRDPFYFERLEDTIKDAGDRYVVVTSHFTLFERLDMLHGFGRTLEDLHLEPERCEKVLDMVLQWKLEHWTSFIAVWVVMSRGRLRLPNSATVVPLTCAPGCSSDTGTFTSGVHV